MAAEEVAGKDTRKSKLRRYALFGLKAAVGVGLVACMVHSGHLAPRQILEALSGGRWWMLAAFAVLALIPLLGGLRWWLMLHAQGLAVPVSSAVRLTYVGAFFNTFLPGSTGGDVVRIYGAAVSFRDRRAAAVLTVIADRLAGLLALIALALIVLTLNYDAIVSKPLVREAAAILLGAMLSGALLVILALSNRLRERRREFLSKPGRVREALRRADEALAIYRGKRAVLLAAAAISLLAHLCSVAAVFCTARALGEAAIPAVRYLFLVPLAMAANSIPVSPGGMGQGEGFAEALFRTQGSDIGAEAFFVYRVAAMLAWLVGLAFYLTGSVRFDEMAEVEQSAEQELHQSSAGGGVSTGAPGSESQG